GVVLLDLRERDPGEVLVDAPVQRDVFALGADVVLGLGPPPAAVQAAADDGEREQAVHGPLEPPAVLGGFDEVVVAVGEAVGGDEAGDVAAAGRAELAAAALGAPAAEAGGAAGRGLHDAVVVQLVLVLGDRAHHDRGVGQLPGQGA